MKVKPVVAVMLLVLFVISFGYAASDTQQIDIIDVGNKICPVMGGEVNSDISYVYEGKRYYFCCPPCIEKFKSDPEKYIVKISE